MDRDGSKEGAPQEAGQELTGEHRLGDAGQLVLAVLFMVAWISDAALGYSTWLNPHLPLAVRIPIGVALLLVSAYLASMGLSTVFGKRRPGPGVIRTGVFGVVRHPVYLSEILAYLGMLMLNVSLAAAAVWLAAVLFLHAISRYEECLLLARFGADYQDYMRQVPMWIPRLRKR